MPVVTVPLQRPQPTPTIDIAYRSIGNGTHAVLLLPGLCVPPSMYHYLAAVLAQTPPFLPVLISNRGIPPSDAPSASFLRAPGYSALDLAYDSWAVLDVVRDTGLVGIVGHSMGGMIAQEMVRLRPHRIGFVALLSTHWGGWWERIPTSSMLLAGARLMRNGFDRDEMASVNLKLHFTERFLNHRFGEEHLLFSEDERDSSLHGKNGLNDPNRATDSQEAVQGISFCRKPLATDAKQAVKKGDARERHPETRDPNTNHEFRVPSDETEDSSELEIESRREPGKKGIGVPKISADISDLTGGKSTPRLTLESSDSLEYARPVDCKNGVNDGESISSISIDSYMLGKTEHVEKTGLRSRLEKRRACGQPTSGISFLEIKLLEFARDARVHFGLRSRHFLQSLQPHTRALLISFLRFRKSFLLKRRFDIYHSQYTGREVATASPFLNANDDPPLHSTIGHYWVVWSHNLDSSFISQLKQCNRIYKLVMTGRHDRVIVPNSSRRLARGIGAHTIVEVDAAHFIVDEAAVEVTTNIIHGLRQGLLQTRACCCEWCRETSCLSAPAPMMGAAQI